MKWRIAFLMSAFGAVYCVLLINAYNIQILKGGDFVERADAGLQSVRGSVYFTDKNSKPFPAAINNDFPIVYAVPKEIEDSDETAIKLAEIVPLPTEEIKRRLSKPEDEYEVILEKANSDELTKIKSLNIKGIYIKTELLRYYPLQKIASHLLGFVANVEDGLVQGKYGIEKQFNSSLSGQAGEKTVESGEDVNLTIDYNIQAAAGEILNRLIGEYSAIGGTIIVQEPKTGKILAMENSPGFDPNEYSEYQIAAFLNPALQAVYEPGSVFKLVTMSAGLDSGKITPDTTYVDKGFAVINGSKVQNWDLKAHGKLTMTEVIEQSINTGTIFAERQTGHKIFREYLEKFGFGELTGITLPGEVRGSLTALDKGQDINFATASYGQGVSVTPLQMIGAVSTIANDGVLMKPLILVGDKPQVVRRAISSESAQAVTKMMVSAVIKNKLAAISNYNVAGKTGTAFVPNFGGKGYSDDVINTYAGFAPASDPKFVILIKLDKPKGAPLAGATVVPAFRELAEFILNYYNIPPDKI